MSNACILDSTESHSVLVIPHIVNAQFRVTYGEQQGRGETCSRLHVCSWPLLIDCDGQNLSLE